MTLEHFLEELRKYEKQPKMWVVDLERQTEFTQAYREISALVLKEEPTAKIECAMHEVSVGAGVIRIEADWVTVREIQKFCTAISKANNLEIYPIADDALRMSIVFYGIYKRIV